MKNRNNSLKHWGIKGMKWGVRRYQNADGTLTDIGKQRRASEYDALSDKSKRKYKENVDKWVNEDMQNARNIANDSANLTRTAKNAVDNNIRKTPKVKMDLSNMSDQEMRNKINREMLERQYNDLFAPKKSTRGKEIVSNTLAVAGGVLTAGATALSIALSIQQLRGKGK